MAALGPGVWLAWRWKRDTVTWVCEWVALFNLQYRGNALQVESEFVLF